VHFESPWAFLLLLAIPALLWRGHRRRASASIRFSSVQNAGNTGKSLRQRLGFIPAALRALALVFLIIALARPQKGLEQVREINEGIAIEMVVDRSGSMAAEMQYQGQRLNRLEVVKRVFQDFVLGGKGNLKGRPSDLVGMIAFARYPDTVCPLTLAHGALPRFLETVKLVQYKTEDGTAIGDALALAAARLRTAEEALAEQTKNLEKKEYAIKSKIVILLTDGENNCGERNPLQAADLAAKWGIKVYTIGVGGGESVTTINTPFGDYKVPMGGGIDEGTLKEIARRTGAIYRSADTANALYDIYEEIASLEKTSIETVRYTDYKEEFALWAMLALACVCVESGLAATVYRRIP
jgi:Ca-activated chloride channel family protein